MGNVRKTVEEVWKYGWPLLIVYASCTGACLEKRFI